MLDLCNYVAHVTSVERILFLSSPSIIPHLVLILWSVMIISVLHLSLIHLEESSDREIQLSAYTKSPLLLEQCGVLSPALDSSFEKVAGLWEKC